MSVATDPILGEPTRDKRLGAPHERQERRQQHRRSDNQRVLPADHPGHLLRAGGQARLLRRRQQRLRLLMTTATAPSAMDAEAIWRELRVPLLAFIARRVSDPDTAEDILQDIMLRIHRHSSDRTQPASITAWLYGVARNAIIDHYRRASVRRERPAGTYLDLHEAEEPPDAGTRDQQRPSSPVPDPTARTAAGDLPRRAPADRRRRAHPGRCRCPAPGCPYPE